MRPIAALAVALLAGALAACDRPTTPTPSQPMGQRSDSAAEQRGSATARMEQKSEPAQSSAQQATGQMPQGAERGTTEVSNKVKDAAITTAVNAKIAQDPKLSVLRINVDTVGGRVQLRGSAPDAASSERAQQLASTVEGVVGVDNQLVVGGKG
jgi:osmotically-inducible protein OsmY